MPRLEYVPFAPLHTHYCGLCRQHWFCEATVNEADCGLSTCAYCRRIIDLAAVLVTQAGVSAWEAVEEAAFLLYRRSV